MHRLLLGNKECSVRYDVNGYCDAISYSQFTMWLAGKERGETNFFNTSGRNRVKRGMEPEFAG